MKTKRRRLIAGIVIGSLLTLGPLFGMLGTVFGMTRSFQILGSSGVTDPQALSDSIGVTLLATATGLFLFPVGILILTLSLIFFARLHVSPPSLPPQPNETGNT